MKNFRSIKLMIIIMLCCFSCGCARSVVERVPSGERVVASINFASNLNFAKNKYYMMISSSPAYQLPFYPYEFIEPGYPPVDPQIDYYKFYSTWSGYVVVDGGMVYLIPGPFTSTTESYQRIQIGGPLGLGRNMSFQFRLEQIFGASLPDVVYFDFISVDESRFLKDHLFPPSKSIMKYEGMIVSGSDEGSSDIDPSLDILDWSVSIQ